MELLFALITARGGSKGIPGKNLRPLAGKPLIAWSIEAALASQRIERVIVSTDCEEIARVSRQWGAETPFLRPPELGRDDSAHIDTMIHALTWLRESEGDCPQLVLTMQPTSPLRTADDIDGAVALLEAKDAPAVVSVCHSHQHPYAFKTLSPEGEIEELLSTDVAYCRRQAFPATYYINGAIYLNRSDMLLRDRMWLPPGTLGYEMPASRSYDIDTFWDLRLAEMILEDQHVRKIA